MNKKDLFRMFPWLVLAAGLYGIAMIVQNPQLQTLFWKLGHITVAAYLGYWLDRHLLGRYVPETHFGTHRVLARAFIVGSVILGVAFGL